MKSLFELDNFKSLLKKDLRVPSPIVDLYRTSYRKEERDHIDAIINKLQNTHPTYAREIINRLLVDSEYLGAWYELMVYDWLSEQSKNPLPQPVAPDGKSKPDFLFDSFGKKVYIDVASVQESSRDKAIYDSPNFWQPEATSTFATMRERLLDKMGKHSSISSVGASYIICLGLESPLIYTEDVKTCFLGNGSLNLSSNKLHSAINGEIFEKEKSGAFLVKNKNVSGLLVAKHNWGSKNDGYRLVFGFIQNPFAYVGFQADEFDTISKFVVIAKTGSIL